MKYLNRNVLRTHLSFVCKAMTVAIGPLNTAGVQLFSASFIYDINTSLLGQTRTNKRIVTNDFYSNGTNTSKLFLSYAFHKKSLTGRRNFDEKF